MPRKKWSELRATLPPEVQERARLRAEAMLAELRHDGDLDDSADGCDGDSRQADCPDGLTIDPSLRASPSAQG